MTLVLILRGIPGAGKTAHVKSIAEAHRRLVPCAAGALHPCCQRADETGVCSRHATKPWVGVISADDYFTDVGDGRYRFDRAQLTRAHDECWLAFERHVSPALQERLTDVPPSMLIIDNTNTSVAELAPYASYGSVYGHNVEILTLLCEPGKAHARQLHGVDPLTLWKMDQRLRAETASIPPWWKHRVTFT